MALNSQTQDEFGCLNDLVIFQEKKDDTSYITTKTKNIRIPRGFYDGLAISPINFFASTVVPSLGYKINQIIFQ